MTMHAALVQATLAPENLAALEAVIRARIAAEIRTYADENHRHVDDGTGACLRTPRDRCDITAAYRHAANIAGGKR